MCVGVCVWWWEPPAAELLDLSLAQPGPPQPKAGCAISCHGHGLTPRTPWHAPACRYERALVDAELHGLGDQLLKKFDETERALLTVGAGAVF